jgi:DinB superfamily
MTDVLDAARRILSTTPGRWRSLVETVPEELLRRPPAPGEWSAVDCLHHLLLAERGVFGARLRAILEGGDLAAFDPGQPHGPGPEQALAALAAARDEHLAILSGLAPADVERTGHHPQYGAVPLRTILNTWAAHDLQHTVQAEEALMQEFIPETGPFRFRFADHDVEAGAQPR